MVEVFPAPLAPIGALELSGITFSYEENKAHKASFNLGPINFLVHPGELVFVVGGNGSGKSTFVKVLTGLYPASSGTIRIGRTVVTTANYVWYRQHFSAVFSDYHLFPRVYGIHNDTIDASVRHYLKLLEIDRKVSIADGCFSTVDLSQGQRRRLALLSAYLEDRPIYVFDEWRRIRILISRGFFTTSCFQTSAHEGKRFWWSLMTIGIIILAIES